MLYEAPTIEDYGTLVELTAMMNVGGPEDALQKGVGADSAPPGHTCPTGPPPGNGNAGGGVNNGNPQCNVPNGGGGPHH
jgi:hypothetical protein